MNLWTRFLMYYYSGVALGALISGRFMPLEGEAGETEEQMQTRRGKIVVEAQKIGDLMATSTETNLVASYNQHILNIYEQQKQKAAAVQGA